MSARVLPLVLTVGLVVGCAHHPAPVAAAPAPAPALPAPAAPAPAAVVRTASDDGGASRLAALRAVVGQMTYFAFNALSLTADDQTTLDAKVPILAANPGLALRVAGNCDDRGSDEYNLVLGQRRAEAAKRYLGEHGIAGARIATISYGKERPIAQGDNEQSWSQNRNDQFEITAGGSALTAPQGQ